MNVMLLFRRLFRGLFLLLGVWLICGILQVVVMKYHDHRIKEYLPACKLADMKLKSIGSISAGCYIQQDKKFLVVHNPIILLNGAASGKYSVPGGSVNRGESSACAAARETFEESGIDVTVTKEIKSFGNGFVLFECVPVNPITEEQLKYSKIFEISKIELVAPHEIKLDKARFPSQIEDIVEYHNSVH